MSDTGRIPGEGLPENTGTVEQPGVPAPDSYTYLEPSAHTPEDDDLLLMPSAQGAWGEPQPTAQPADPYADPAAQGAYQPHFQPQPADPAHAQGPVQLQEQAPAYAMHQAAPAPLPETGPGAHESGGRDSGSVDLGAVRIPAAAQTPVRRPLHRGPASPEPSYGGTSGAGVVRSLADRGPAGAPPARHAGPATAEPEYFDPQPADRPLPGPQLGEIPPQTAHQWTPEAPVAEQPVAEPVAAPAEVAAPDPVAVAEPETAPVAEVAAPAPVAEPVPAAEPEPVAVAEPVPAPEPQLAPAAEAPAEPQAESAAEPQPEPAPAAAPQFVAVAEPVPAAEPEPVAVADPVQAPEPQPAPAAEPEPVAVAEPVAAPEPQLVPAAEPEPVAVAEPVTAPEAQPVPAAAPEPVAVAEPVQAPQAQPAPAPEPQPAPAPEPQPEAVAEPAPAPEPEAAPAPEAVAEQPIQPEALAPVSEPEPGPEVIETPDLSDEAEPATAEAPELAPTAPPAPGYDDAEREAVLRVMRERRDIRNGFRSDPIPHEVLLRVLEAAHTAPSVGHSQPWDFVVIRSAETRRSMHELAQQQREAYAKSLPKARAKQFKELKIEAILDTPVNIVVTADPTRGGRHTLGRHTQPQMAPYSSALAVENLWLAARAEGLGVGWVSFFDEREMVRALGLPEHLEIVAYLCVGYVDEFPEDPELMQAGWSKRRPLSWVVHEETYGRRALPGEAPHDLLQETISNIRPLDAKALGEAWERQKRMTKPAGALGMLEIISAQLAGLSRMCPPPIPEPAAVAVFAGDHGVHAQGVTAWPQEVTGQMIANMLGGGAVCNAFASQVGAEVCVVDVGAVAELPPMPGLLPRKVRAGTADFTTGPALTREEVHAAIEVGIETARDLVAAGNKGLLTGEMGIANTTASAALICVYTGMDPAEITGRGTGINDEMHARKIDVVRRALELHQPDPADPIGVLAAVGGLEHAAMAGFLLGGASLRTPVILDGVSAGAAALVARAIAPEALAACIAGHRSAEPGHVAALNKLGLRPLVDLDLRLGEGTGALLALPIVQSAARAMHEVATFDSAGVTEK
ncbi:nicotinate-nucleotide--dimethylbenzimidazole phosphoribosyltransferase [Streptomyces drozdowiczii]|uniref:nicotinate-nucleotide--dimethylbenzimidazole phosphoribosyltransferase n=1 Tax=Streptomyces drozdowiczii TaxID=202862 RepID=UPI0022452EF3|nr:nicotinate-nucleotide--dimethylbenzimidazole phosphoribosyltransferase [Streptomyces drozdowiczii]MCX0242860.1 nicotinate-nucleotide--dimethylbenzimidazole phosphoribosyltransferase [Streptomyces drozdowiczii]